MFTEKKYLSGYAETKFVESYLVYPDNLLEIKKIFKSCIKKKMTICFRGAGLSYADMITNKDNVLLDLSKYNKIISWNKISGEIVVESGVKFSQILKRSLKENYTLSSCPGSFDITIGGAISNNVHGKDSYKNGNFCKQIIEIGLMLANGKMLILNKENNYKLFKAVIGGMGLLGLITHAKIKLTKIPSPFVLSKSHVTKNIDEGIDLIENLKENNDFIVSWIDAFSKSKNIGRGIVSTANWIDKPKFNSSKLKTSLEKSDKIFGLLPSHLTWKLIKPFFHSGYIKRYNMILYNYNYLKFLFNLNKKREMFSTYNFIHNKLPDLKEVYKPYGFLEFQPLLPYKNIKHNLKKILKLCQSFGSESLLAGLKVHKSDDSLLSFQLDGYSIGIDLDVKSRKKQDLEIFCKDLFNLTTDCGGIIYLAKDEYLNKKYFKTMYPGLQEFLNLKKIYDPNNLFGSDIFNRLFK